VSKDRGNKRVEAVQMKLLTPLPDIYRFHQRKYIEYKGIVACSKYSKRVGDYHVDFKN
jgi:hypothetical protein